LSIKNKYFSILGIAPTNDEAIIKKAYRKLAFKYHPDKNNSSSAQAKFIEITEAYEIVTGTQKLPSQISVPTKTPEEIRQDRIKAAKKRYKRSKQKEIEEELEYYKLLISGKRWKFIKVFGYVSFGLALLLILDFYLPYQSINETIDYIWRHDNYISLDLKNGSYYFNTFDGMQTLNHPDIKYRQTYIFKDLIDIRVKDYFGEYTTVEPEFTIKRLFPLLPLFLSIPIFTFFYKRPNPLFTILHLTSRYVIPIIFLFVLFSNWRIFKVFF
jgi:hypothetical protein